MFLLKPPAQEKWWVQSDKNKCWRCKIIFNCASSADSPLYFIFSVRSFAYSQNWKIHFLLNPLKRRDMEVFLTQAGGQILKDIYNAQWILASWPESSDSKIIYQEKWIWLWNYINQFYFWYQNFTLLPMPCQLCHVAISHASVGYKHA